MANNRKDGYINDSKSDVQCYEYIARFISCKYVYYPNAEIRDSVHEDEKTLARLWHEEIKCLFLRCRAPPDVAIERLVKNIFNYDLYSNNAEEVIGHSKRVLTDFCSKLLFRYLATTDKAKLKKCGIMERLVLFVVEAFKVHYVKYDVKTIKDLDRITMECKVPSRSGKNIASRLSLE
ncbi:unnamed protein product [Rhizophagus irregularis]|uniref:Uncharacterized protein n=1 Tax=Rhizophagus irregularis TaxID=588596 RepID=A0A916EDK9_9GLOM|nr:unnamed protein product [Rhizophagus irregularis]